ncbi:MAG: response regulator [Deltaproteobacteria bacterium]|nr:response regulator [Deltaproteobacteria bacterium]
MRPALDAASRIAAFAAAIADSCDASPLLAARARAVAEFLGAVDLVVCRRDPAAGARVLHSLLAEPSESFDAARLDDAFWRQYEGEASLDLAAQSDFPESLRAHGSVRAVAIPCQGDGAPAWFGAFFRDRPGDGCVRLVRALAEIFAHALSTRYAHANHGVRDDVAKVLVSPGPAQEKYRAVAAALRRLISFERFGVITKDRAVDLFRVAYVEGVAVAELDNWTGKTPASAELTRQLAATRRGALVDFAAGDAALSAAYAAGLRSGVAWPLLKDDEFLGILVVSSRRSGAYIDSDVERIGPVVETISQWVSAALDQEQHRETQHRFSDLYERAPDPYQSLDGAGRLLDANLAALDVIGRPREAVLGKPFRDLLSEESRPIFDEAFSRLKRTGQIANIDLTVVRPDDSRREVIWNSTAATGRDGAFSYSRDTTRDVTHLRRLWRERSVRSAVIASLIRARSVRDVAQNALRALVDGHDIIAGRIDAWDHGASMFRWCAGVGLTGWKIEPSAPIPLAQHVAREAIEARETVKIPLGASSSRVIEPALRDVKGTLLLFPLAMRGRTLGVLSLVHQRTGTSVDDDVRVLGAVAGDVSVVLDNARLYDDLDETNRQLMRRQSEEIHREKLAAVGQLAAGIAHEINNPLMFILGNLNLVQEQLDATGTALRAYREAVTDSGARTRLADLEQGLGVGEALGGTELEARRLVGDSLEGVRRIRDVVGTLLRFAKGSPEETSVCDLHLVIRRAVAVVHNEVAHRATLVTKFGDVPLLRCVTGNIEQAIVNLLLNAAQAIEPGRAGKNAVTIETWVDDNRAKVRVSDTGCGIAVADLARVTEPFFTTKPLGEGTGLGLTLVHEILRNAGGEVSIKSEEGKGTSVTLALPLQSRTDRKMVVSPEDAQKSREREKARPPAPLQVESLGGPSRAPTIRLKAPATSAPTPPPMRHRILIIDDEELTLKLLSRIFGKTYDLLVAASGSQALSLLEGETARPPDFILCDLMMPDLTGMAFYAAIEKRYPKLAERTFFLTGGAFTDEARSFVDRMGPRVFFKPLEVQQIRKLLDDHLRTRDGASA